MSYDEILYKLAAKCSVSEQCMSDIEAKLSSYDLTEEERTRILRHLVEEKYIDDRRYAEAFVRDKLNLSGWGAYKIKLSLRAKGVARDIIEEVVAPMIEATDMKERLEEIMQRKLRTLKYTTTYEAKTKLIRFAASRGYDIEEAIECASRILND